MIGSSLAGAATRARVATIATGVLVCLWSAPAGALELRGPAKAIDSDTLALAGERVRLLDVDAVELGQKCEGPKELRACGAMVAAMVRAKLDGGPVVCRGSERDDYDRLLAHCEVGGTDLSTWLVQEGYGLAFRRYSTRLVPEEKEAQAAKRGLWRASFEPPWEYRARRWKEAGSKAPGGCAIKGDINQEGERIYHTPWGNRFYERTRINEKKGERWFCSEKEALAAGFRAPLVH